MNRDTVKRLAIQSGIDLEFFQAGELFSFATAIVKQYQADNYQIRTDNTQTIANMEAKIAELEDKCVSLLSIGKDWHSEYLKCEAKLAIAVEVLEKVNSKELSSRFDCQMVAVEALNKIRGE